LCEVKIRYNSAKSLVKEKENKLNLYNNQYNEIKNIHEICEDEDKKYKTQLYTTAKRIKNIQKEKLAESHKFLENKCINDLFSTTKIFKRNI
jgi:hypothetical protein